MKKINTYYFLSGLLFLLLNCQSKTKEPSTIKVESDFAITNVSVLPMTSEQVLKNQTIIVKDGKIVAIQTEKPTTAAKIIDGTGKFLMPGLTEMHAHIPVLDRDGEEMVRQTLFLYLSQGITTIRGMLGNPYHLDLKKQVANGEILSPRIYTSSPSLNGNTMPSVEVAKEKVTQYQKDGYDFLKIHPGIQLEVWHEIEKIANSVGIPFAGHVPVAVGIHRALAAGYQTIDHLDGYLEGLVPASEKVDSTKTGFFGYGFIDLLDESLIDSLVAETVENGVGVVPTQTLFTRWFSPESPEKMGNEPEMKYMPSKTLFAWRQSKSRLINDESYEAKKWEKYIAIRNKLMKTMDEKGVTFLLGSDAPQVFNVPGFSLHHELKAMKAAGISNFKILQSGTANPAKFFNAAGQYGTIEIGSAADLILMEGNPLEDLANAQKIVGVAVNGKWVSRSEIDKELAEIAANNL